MSSYVTRFKILFPKVGTGRWRPSQKACNGFPDTRPSQRAAPLQVRVASSRRENRASSRLRAARAYTTSRLEWRRFSNGAFGPSLSAGSRFAAGGITGKAV